MGAFIVVVVVIACIVGLFEYMTTTTDEALHERYVRPFLHLDDEPVKTDDKEWMRLETAIMKIRHAATPGSARSALAAASALADQLNSADHMTQARTTFVRRIHELANQAEVQGRDWKAAEILKEALPYATNRRAVERAIAKLQGGAATDGGSIF